MKTYQISTPTGEVTVQLDDEDAEARGLTGGTGGKDTKTRSTADKRAEVADKSFNKPPAKKT
jgi:hypothetical protein